MDQNRVAPTLSIVVTVLVLLSGLGGWGPGFPRDSHAAPLFPSSHLTGPGDGQVTFAGTQSACLGLPTARECHHGSKPPLAGPMYSSIPVVADAPWADLSPSPHPPALSGGALAYDAADGYLLLFGGGVGTVSGYATYHPVNYTWAYDASSDVWTNESRTRAPPASDQWAMAYDPAGGYVVAFGGGSNQTWAYAHGAWTELNPMVSPRARYLPCMAYDSEDGYVLLFGGSASISYSSVLDDTWSFSAGSWTNRTQATSPPGGGGCSLSNDARTGPLVEFGGWAHPADFDPTTNETWEYGSGQWTEIRTNNIPTGRYGGMLSFIPACGCDLLFGGFFFYGSSGGGGEGVLGDSWLLQNGQWNRLFPSPAPSTRATAPFALDPVLGIAVLFGGFDYGGLDSDTWSFKNPLSLSPSLSSHRTAEVGQADTLTPIVSGGEAPFNFTWSGLPTECASVPGGAANCQMTSPAVASVEATATDSGGYDATLEFTLEVLPAVVVSATCTPNATDSLTTVEFVANATAGLSPYSFSWNLSDGAAVTGPSILHSFAAAGPAFATVTVTDSLDGTSSATIPVAVASAPELMIVAGASTALVGQSVTLRALVSGGTGPFSVSWSLGDGRTEEGLTITHDYAAAAQYEITADLTDAASSHASNTTVVTVSVPSNPGWVPSTGVFSTVVLAISAVSLGGIVAVIVVARRRKRP
jgi:hypothetical protein